LLSPVRSELGGSRALAPCEAVGAMVAIYPCLHEIFGVESTWAEIVVVLSLALGMTCTHALTVSVDASRWRYWLGLLLAGDVYAGCIANFTQGTNNHYASSAWRRWVFISVHWHLIGVFVLWRTASDGSFFACLVVNVLVLVAASITNLTPKARGAQRFAGGVCMVTGVFFLMVVQPVPPEIMPVAVMFLLKVAFAFAVDHYHGLPTAATSAKAA